MEKYGKYIDFSLNQKPIMLFVEPLKHPNLLFIIEHSFKLPILSTSLTSDQTKFCYTFADSVDEDVIRMHFPKGEERELDKLLEKA